ncbi:MAG: Glycerol-3-phosphate transporter, periplasmic glycerol-3-phosphate-binding protein [Labilithrix sp.]|nr:Glycerol-3-phosphate transporter, periplasmic glycerol-3-phosphate-binding protein [Labilithrix sp.]
MTERARVSRRQALLSSLTVLGGAASCARSPRDGRGRVRLRLWYSLGGRNREVLLEIVKRFHASQDRIVVEPVYQGDYFESLAKLRTAVAAGAAPALSHVVAEVLPYLERAGALEPLDGYPGMADLSLVTPLAQAGGFRGGGARPLVGIPLNRSTPLMYCNGRLFAEAGLRPPTTWTEMLEAARALTRPGERWGHEVPISWWFWVALVGQAGGQVFDEAGQPTLGGEAGVRALALWQDLVHRHRVMRPPPGRDYDAWNVVNQDFLGERAAFIWTSTAYIRYLEDNARFPVIAAPLPREVRASVPTGGTFFVVVKQAPAEEKEAAARFLRFFCEPAQAVLLSTRTGYLPITTAAAAQMRSDGFFAAHPNDDVAQHQLASVEPWPWEKYLFRIERDIVDPRLEEAVLLDHDARGVLAEARELARRPG